MGQRHRSLQCLVCPCRNRLLCTKRGEIILHIPHLISVPFRVIMCTTKKEVKTHDN
nr:MAG TPA: hypothetical protein [Caudoviricetes sp.]